MRDYDRSFLMMLVLLTVLWVCFTASQVALASPLEYPFHATKVVNVRSGFLDTTGGVWSPTPYNKTAVVRFGSRNAMGRTFAQKAVRLGPAAIKNAARLRMLGPAGLALGVALEAHDIFFDETSEEFELPSDYPSEMDTTTGTTYTDRAISSDMLGGCSFATSPWRYNNCTSCGKAATVAMQELSDWLVSPCGSSTGSEFTGELRINVDLSDSGGVRIEGFVDRSSGTGWIDVGRIAGPPSLVGAITGHMTGTAEWDDIKGGLASDEALYSALDSEYSDGTGTGQGTWNDFFTDPVTGNPLSIPEFEQAAADVTADYEAWLASNPPADEPVPGSDEVTQYRQDDDFNDDFGGESDTGSSSDQCAENPDSLACLDVGTELTEQELAGHEIGFSFDPVNLQSGGTQCPAPISVSTGIGSIDLSYEGACTAAQYMAPIIPVFGAFAALLIIVGVRNE